MKTADELLRRLLEEFFAGDRFQWSYQEGYSLADVNPDLARDLAAWRALRTTQPPAAPTLPPQP